MDTHIYELFTTNLSYVREHSSPKGKPIELKNEKYQSTDEFSRNVGDWIANHVKSIEKLIRTELGENHKLLSINSVDLITDRVLIYLEEFPADAEEINFSSIVTALRPPLLKLQKLASDPSFEVYGTQPLPEEELQEMIKGNTKEKRIYFRLVNNALLKALSQQLRGEKDPQLSKQETSSSLFQNFKFQRAVIKILDDGPAQMQEVSSQQNHNGPNSMISKCQENQQKTRADSLREKYENYQRNEKQSDEKNSNAYTYDVPDPTYLSAYSKSKPKSEPYFKEIDEKTRKAKFFRNRNKTGLIYEGFVNELGQKHGKGRYNYPNGDIYEGQFVNDQCEGEGKLFFKIGGQSECPGGYYEGGFKANKMEGLGKLVNKNGVPIYHGEFKQNVKDGFGRLFLENSDWYVGHFSNNFRHGQGTLFIRKEYALEGNWETNRKHGEFKKYREWIFDREGIPQVKNEKDNEIVYYRQDQLSNTKPSRITFVDSSDSKILGSNTSQRTNRPNREIITRFGIRLTDEDMVTLKGSNPLGANIVNAYMRAIEERYLELFCANVRDLPRILFLDSDFFSQLTLDDLYAKEISYEKVQNALAAHSSNENSAFDLYDRILIAVNKSGSHWVLAEIFCYHSDKGKATDLEFRVYDSMAEERVFDDPRKDPIFRHLQDFALVEMEERFKGKRPQIMAMILKATYKYMQVPRQRDMYNCGVFLCKFIQHLGSGKQKIAFDSSVQEMNALRKEIEKVLLNKCENPLLPSVVDSDQEEENYISKSESLSVSKYS